MALISNPKILLLDEPFAALDVMTIKMLQEIIVNLQNTDGVSIILCDMLEIIKLCDVAAIINNGRVIGQGTPSNLIQDINARNAYLVIHLE